MRVKFGVLIGMSLLPAMLPLSAMASVDCNAIVKPRSAAANALQLSPIAEELAAPSAQLGAGVGFAKLLDDRVTVDLVISRMQHQQCLATAPAASSAKPGAGAYAPAGSKDAGAWRFDMTQNGKRMTADEFDAWMKARGVRVVPAANKPAAPAEPPPPAAEPPKKKKR